MPEPTVRLILFLVCVGAFTLVAAVWDFRTRRIPNALTVPMFFLGLAYQGVFGGWSGAADGGLSAAGLASALQGFALGFGLLFVVWLIGGGGGGDVKLMGALAVWLGFRLTLLVLVASTVFVLLGTLFVFVGSMLTRGPGRTKRKFIATSKPSSVGKDAPLAPETAAEKQQRRIMAYAMPVAAATWVVALLKFAQL